ncbi:MAG: hypothetical protein JXR94_20300 [Candidatus Hydrogenedentes bacterium]|nr:hypothetical protein [Candidatus Hydrogenedentota bacterium]
MRLPSNRVLSSWATAILLWVGLGFSLAWYHYLAEYGRAGWPVPTPEAAAGLLIYRGYASPLQRLVRDVYWLVAVAGGAGLWVGLLHVTAPYFGGGGGKLCDVARDFAYTSVPLVVLGPLVTAAAWYWEWGYWWSRTDWFAAWARLARPWPWLGPAYLAAAGAALAFQFVVYWKTVRVRGVKLVAHLAICLGLLATCAIGAGTLLHRVADRLF